VRRLVVVGASAGLADDGLREARAADDRQLSRHILRVGTSAFIAEWEQKPLIRTQDTIEPTHRAAMRAARQAHSAEGLALSLSNMGLGAMPPLHDALPKVRIPVLCVAGADDLRYRAAATEVAQLLPFGRILFVPGAGHAAHLEAPEAFLRGVLPFLNDDTDERSL
jgi:2-succinyl-6-hydroxy-2,4-cyclohexadiene-1-carboxylate synthase